MELLNDKKHHGPLQFVVTRVARNGTVTVVGTNVLEWRRVLVTGEFEGPIELFRFGGGSQVPVGVISVRLERSPAIKPGTGLENQFLSDHFRTEFMVRSKARQSEESTRAFRSPSGRRVWRGAAARRGASGQRCRPRAAGIYPS